MLKMINLYHFFLFNSYYIMLNGINEKKIIDFNNEN